jgi:AmmeMemoRadiSam system protein B
MSTIRRASHSGSWYTKSGDSLKSQLSKWLSEVDIEHMPAKAIIAPHAGYSYSGPCAAYAYRQIDPTKVLVITNELLFIDVLLVKEYSY